MRRRIAWSCAGAIALAGLAVIPPAQATTVKPLNLEEMTARAATIFSGRCLTVRVMHDAALGADVTVVTFHVDRALKGTLGATHRIRLLGDVGLTDSDRGAGALPGFRPGEEVVLFLYGESALGLSAPVGMGQGKFAVLEDKHGEKIAVNALGKGALWRGLSPDAAARVQAHGAQRGDRAVGLSTLLDMVEALAR